MFRIVLFVAGCITGYVASGYLDGLLSDEEDDSQPPPTQKGTEAAL